MLSTVLIYGFTVIYLIITGFLARKIKFTTQKLCMTGAVVAVTLILSMIRIPTPIGSSITALSILPIMLFSILYGAPIGMFAGLVTSLLAMIVLPGWALVHPAQFLVEHLVCFTCLGYAGISKGQKKSLITASCILAVILNVLAHTFCGVLFFSQNAPSGWGAWWYSIVYNFSAHGVEGAITVIVLTCMPIAYLKKSIGGNESCRSCKTQ